MQLKQARRMKCIHVAAVAGMWSYYFERQVSAGFDKPLVSETLTVVLPTGNAWQVGDTQCFDLTAR